LADSLDHGPNLMSDPLKDSQSPKFGGTKDFSMAADVQKYLAESKVLSSNRNLKSQGGARFLQSRHNNKRVQKLETD